MIKTAGCLIIGNEILTSKTKDINLNHLAEELFKSGIDLMQAIVVRDIKDDIIWGVKELSKKYDYVFTSGGIGPTHDDITTESIAQAFSLDVELNKDAHKLLKEFYGENITEARLKMASIPFGAKLIENKISTAPGFQVENVFVMAGVPKIFKSMLNEVLSKIEKGETIKSVSHIFSIPESDIAKPLTKIAMEFEKDGVEIGSYPKMEGNSWVVEIVVRSRNEGISSEVMNKVKEEFAKIIPTWKFNGV